jgi:hypothetical protein
MRLSLIILSHCLKGRVCDSETAEMELCNPLRKSNKLVPLSQRQGLGPRDSPKWEFLPPAKLFSLPLRLPLRP